MKLFRTLMFWRWWKRLRCHRGILPCPLIDGPTEKKVAIQKLIKDVEKDRVWKKWNQ